LFFAPSNPDFTPALSLGGIGIRESMPPGFVDRPTGFGRQPAYLLMQFHDPVLVELAEGRREVPDHTTVLWEPTMSHFFGRPDREWNHSWLMVRGTTATAILQAAGIPALTPLPMADNAILPVLEWIFQELETYQPPDILMLEHCLQLLARSIRRGVSGSFAAPVPEPLSRVFRLIESRITAPLTLNELANAAHLSVSRFSQLFREHLGQSPMRYLEERRLQRAGYLLANQSLNIGEIASAVGYPDPLHFSRRFRTRFGSSPSDYRKRHFGLGAGGTKNLVAQWSQPRVRSKMHCRK
jgi:AraC-like DNA-binding protein